MLAPGTRTVTAGLRVLGHSAEAHFQHDPRVVKRARWSSLDASPRRLRRLLDAFVPEGPGGMGMDETLERRQGERIAAQAISRDPVRSSHAHFVKASGWRPVSLMVLARMPWGDRGWVLPFLPGLAPSERYYQGRGRRPPSWRDRARPAVQRVRRWGPARELVLLGDRTDAAREGLDAVRESACVITRWRLDAARDAPAPPRTPPQKGRPRQKGMRRPTLACRAADPTTCWQPVTVAPWFGQNARRVDITSATAVWYPSGVPPVPIRGVLSRAPAGQFAPQAWLSTNPDVHPVQSLTWFMQRWQLETTVEAARAQLGLATPRPWNDRSVSRPTPAVCGRYSIITLAAAHLIGEQPAPGRTTAWYPKPQATFSDAMA